MPVLSYMVTLCTDLVIYFLKALTRTLQEMTSHFMAHKNPIVERATGNCVKWFAFKRITSECIWTQVCIFALLNKYFKVIDYTLILTTPIFETTLFIYISNVFIYM